MVVAPDFVFVHLSKTGGSFAAETIREVLCPSLLGRKIHRLKVRDGVRMRIPLYKYRYNDVGDMHAVCNDIPKVEQAKTILSCIRNPFDLYVSEYTYDWWKEHPDRWFHDPAAVEKTHPDWRNLNFHDFISVSNKYASWVHKTLVKYPQSESLSWYSHKFIYYFCRDQDYVFEAAADLDLLEKRVRESMYPVHFLHTDRLNKDLFEFLLAKGYPRPQIEFIPQKDKVNSSRPNHRYREWYSNDLRREVEKKDALLFRLFPEFQF